MQIESYYKTKTERDREKEKNEKNQIDCDFLEKFIYLTNKKMEFRWNENLTRAILITLIQFKHYMDSRFFFFNTLFNSLFSIQSNKLCQLKDLNFN